MKASLRKEFQKLDDTLAAMRKNMAERKKILADARKMREQAIEVGAINQRSRRKKDDPVTQKNLNGVSLCIEEIDAVIKEQETAIAALKEMERLGEGLRYFGLSPDIARRCE